MADLCFTCSTQELDGVHRLLPPEIFKDIGIVDPAERRRLAAVEDIARRLAGVLGEATKRAPRHAPPSCHRPQVCAWGAMEVDLAGGGVARRPAAPPFLPSPAVPWQAMEAAGRTGRDRATRSAAALPRFTPASPLLVGARPPATRRSCGTGVFLPCTDAVRRTTTKAARSPPSNGKHVFAHAGADVSPTRQRQCRPQQHRRWEEAAMARRQQELQAMVARMEVRRQYAVDVHASCPELALPQEWTY